MSKNQKGFGAIEAIIVVVLVAVVGYIGWYVWNQNNKPADQNTVTNNNQPSKADTYAGWLACSDTTLGITFKYPANWSTVGTGKDNSCDIKVDASAAGSQVWLRSAKQDADTSFKVGYFNAIGNSATYNNVDRSYTGETILDVVPLNVPNAPKPLNVVAYAVNSYDATKVAGLVVTDQAYTVGQKVTGSIPFPKSKNGKAFRMDASLSVPSNNQSGEYHSLDKYKNHPDYQTVLDLFKSLSF